MSSFRGESFEDIEMNCAFAIVSQPTHFTTLSCLTWSGAKGFVGQSCWYKWVKSIEILRYQRNRGESRENIAWNRKWTPIITIKIESFPCFHNNYPRIYYIYKLAWLHSFRANDSQPQNLRFHLQPREN